MLVEHARPPRGERHLPGEHVELVHHLAPHNPALVHPRLAPLEISANVLRLHGLVGVENKAGVSYFGIHGIKFMPMEVSDERKNFLRIEDFLISTADPSCAANDSVVDGLQTPESTGRCQPSDEMVEMVVKE